MDTDYSLRKFHKVILIQGAITLVVFAAAVSAAMLMLRGEIRSQILKRDAILMANVSQHFFNKADTGSPDIDLIDVLVESSELSGVIAVRMFNTNGTADQWAPLELYEATLSADDLTALPEQESIVRYHADMHLYTLFSDIDAMLSEETFPVTEVISQIRSKDGAVVAIIQYWLDANSIAAELNDLDHSLILLASAFLIAGGIIFVTVLAVSRRRILRMGRELAEKNRSLQQANTDLALAARTSAIGSITSHLFHDLKNPLAGLKSYLQVTGHDEEAVALTNRMQALINESLRLLQKEGGEPDTILEAGEFEETAKKRLAHGHQNQVSFNVAGNGSIPSQKAMLLILVMRNLIENSVESSEDTSVTVSINITDESCDIRIQDDGPGIPEEVRDQLFDPVTSGKENGTGIGLLISSILARQIPASLELVETGNRGTTFSIKAPL